MRGNEGKVPIYIQSPTSTPSFIPPIFVAFRKLMTALVYFPRTGVLLGFALASSPISVRASAAREAPTPLHSILET